MVTLLCSIATQLDWMEIVGIILACLECLMVVIRIISYFVNPESKFGRFLAKALKGLTIVKKGIEDKKNEEDQDSKPDKE